MHRERDGEPRRGDRRLRHRSRPRRVLGGAQFVGRVLGPQGVRSREAGSEHVHDRVPPRLPRLAVVVPSPPRMSRMLYFNPPYSNKVTPLFSYFLFILSR